MRVRELMRHEVVRIREDATLGEMCDLFQQHHIHGAPVVDAAGQLAGFVSQEDVLFGGMGAPRSSDDGGLHARDVMTSPAVTASEESDLVDVCRLMWRLRIHHVPVVRGHEVTGILSAMDLCRAVSEGSIRVPENAD